MNPKAVSEKMSFLKAIILRCWLLVFLFSVSEGCTNILVTPGASEDGNPMIAYNADDYSLFGSLYHYPPSENNIDSKKMRKCYSWDNGKYLGEIPEANVTYNVVGNTNEHGLVITETTFGGANFGVQEGAILDYGSLIWITLQRSKTAREAIHTMSHLMDTYGYASTGESFSLADRIKGEVWIMEVVSRGKSSRKGAAWVARRIPDGYIASHANQARITTFPRDDPDNCLYSDDVVDLARCNGLYNNENDKDFSFSDIYDKVTFEGARLCDARVWAVFSLLSTDHDFESKYEKYAKGIELSHRMPLWIKPKQKLSLKNVIQLMDNHYENTTLASDQDVGAGPYEAPHRAGPLTWNHKGKCYHNERPIATIKTAFTLVAQIRMHMPTYLSSILWFGVDDSSTAPRYPVYGSSRQVSHAFGGKGPQDGVTSPVLKFDLSKAFWVNNMVANLAYSHQWNCIYPLILERKQKIIDSFIQNVSIIDKEVSEIISGSTKNLAGILKVVTDFSVKAGDQLYTEWLQFYGELFQRFRDFADFGVDTKELVCNCNAGLKQYSDRWQDFIIADTGSHYACRELKEPANFLRSTYQSKVRESSEVGSDNDSVSYLSKLELKSLS